MHPSPAAHGGFLSWVDIYRMRDSSMFYSRVKKPRKLLVRMTFFSLNQVAVSSDADKESEQCLAHRTIQNQQRWPGSGLSAKQAALPE